MKTYYNEWDKYSVQWLRNLADSGEIALGVVDERSIADVKADDLVGYDRCHFFAGIGGWDYALRLAGWPEEWSVWTGSCPCQPFSSAGKQQKGRDERHLWPEFFRLIRECKPPIVLMEQVASKAGLAWLDMVLSDLETAGYSCGAVDLPACSIGAPHIRQRLWIVAILANSCSEGLQGHGPSREEEGQVSQRNLRNNPWHTTYWLPCRDGKLRPTGIVANTESQHRRNISQNNSNGDRWQSRNESYAAGSFNPESGPTQPHILSMADGIPADLGLVRAEGKTIISPLVKKTYARVGRLKGYGNAIVPQVAAVFISIVMEFIDG